MHKLSGSQYHFNYTRLSTALHKTRCLYTTHIFENDLLPTTAVQQRQHVDEAGCHFFWRVHQYVLDILRIPGRCIHICRGCSAPNCTLWLRAWAYV